MRELLENQDGTNARVGIALGVAGGVIFLTGVLWFLYRRYGLGGNLTGIPPERKMLVFTDLGKLRSSYQQSKTPPPAPQKRPSSARPPNRGPLPPTSAAAAATAALTAAVAAATPPSPLPTPAAAAAASPRPAAGRAGPLPPALSVGLEAEPLPSTPGSIASPRGHGRVLFNTMDHPRTSNAGQGLAVAAALGPGGAAAADHSRPGSGSTQRQPRGGSRGGTHDGALVAGGGGGGGGGGGEQPGSGSPGRPSPSGSTAQARGRISLAAVAAAAGGPGGAAAALLPALVPTGSVRTTMTTAWRASQPSGPALCPEQPLNALAAGTTTSPVEAFAGGADSLMKGRASRSRPSCAGDGPDGGGGSGGGGGTDGGGSGGGGSPLLGSSPWQRPGGVRSSRPSQAAGPAGRLSHPGGPDDALSAASAASTPFHSFSHAGEDTGPSANPGPSQLANHHNHQLPEFLQSGSNATGAAAAASGPQTAANPLQRSRLATAASPGPTSGSALGGATPPAGAPATFGDTAAASVALTIAEAEGQAPLRYGTTAAAAAAAREISAELVPAKGAPVSPPSGGGGGSGSALEVLSVGSGGAGEAASPQQLSPSQAAWAAAVSLSSKLFGRGSSSRGAPPAT